MSDLKLYRLIRDCTSEFHSDGIFFIPPWNIKEFVTELGIRDAEEGIECNVVTDGYLAFNLENFESKCEDYEELRDALMDDYCKY